ncbi:T9SS type A sorting domain-containing protein [Niastella populi]|nr:T9SS type A sorting domain-containing protein [Niastella populi]
MKRLLFGMLLLPVAESLVAQHTVTNNGNLTIHSGGNLAVHGHFNNAASASLVNDGNLYIKRDLTSNQAAMSSGSGTLYLDGAVLQTLIGGQPFKTYNLVTGNSAGIYLNTDLYVSGAHSFNSGVITTAATPAYLAYEAGASYSGSADTRHVNGWVRKTGTTGFIYPVGNGAMQRPININNLSESSVFAVKYHAATPNTTQMQSPLVTVDPNEFWEVNRVSGGTARVTLNWDNSKVAMPSWIEPDIRVAAYEGSVWASQGGTASGSVATTGTITSDILSSFNLFTFGSISATLPLTLLQFDAKRKNAITEITWKTAEEQHVSHFTVERSENGTNFYAIGKVSARNAGRTELYSLFDDKPLLSIAYYRLKSTDQDGSSGLSHIVRVTETENGNQVLVNNPVRDRIALTAKGNLSGDFDYSIYDMHGKVVQRGKVNLRTNTQVYISIPGSIPSGSYTINLHKSSTFISKKIIVALTQP